MSEHSTTTLVEGHVKQEEEHFHHHHDHDHHDHDDCFDDEDEFEGGGKVGKKNNNKKQKVYPNGRKRASKACFECQRRHTRCGFERPCERCNRLGLECVDVQSEKKRGRSQKKNDFSSVYNQHTLVDEDDVKPVVRAKKATVNPKPSMPQITTVINSPQITTPSPAPVIQISLADLNKSNINLQQLVTLCGGNPSNINLINEILQKQQHVQQQPQTPQFQQPPQQQQNTYIQQQPIQQAYPVNLGLSTSSQQQQQLFNLLQNDNDVPLSSNWLSADHDIFSGNNDFYLNSTGSIRDEDLLSLDAQFQITNQDNYQDLNFGTDAFLLETPQAPQQPVPVVQPPVTLYEMQEEDTTQQDQERLMKDLSNFKPSEFVVNIDVLKNTYLFASRMGVVISNDVPSISYVSDSIAKKLGYTQTDQLKSYYDIFIPLHINWSIQSIKEDRQKRAEFMASSENGADVLRAHHLKTEHKGRALVIDKFGSVLELAHKCFRIYSSNNPAKVEAVYTFLFW